MGCTFEVLLPATLPGVHQASEAALDEVDRLDRLLSIYRTDSEVSRLNRAAGIGPVPVSPDLRDLIQLSRKTSSDTDGAFDPVTGALVKTWGFHRKQPVLPSPGAIEDALHRSGMALLNLFPDGTKAGIRRNGAELNFGAIGKGYALDRACCRLSSLFRDSPRGQGVDSGLRGNDEKEKRSFTRDGEIPSVLLHGGSSSVLALGRAPGRCEGWKIGLLDPWDESRRIALLSLSNQALGTSGGCHRFFELEGKRYAHILNPRTGYPAEGLRSVTVCAPTAAEADALATAFFILGPEPARRYAEEHPGVAAILFPESPAPAPPWVFGNLNIELRPDVRNIRQEPGESGS